MKLPTQISAKVPLSCWVHYCIRYFEYSTNCISAALDWDKCNKSKMDLYRRIAKEAEKFTIYVKQTNIFFKKILYDF